MSKFSLLICCMLAISSSVIYAQNDGRYRPVATAATKKPLFPVLGKYNPNQNNGKYSPVENGKNRGNEDGKYHAGDEGKYTSTIKKNNKSTKIVKAAIVNKPKVVTRSSNFGNDDTLRKNFARAIPSRSPNPLPPLQAGRGTSVGGNDFEVLYFTNEPEIDGYRFTYGTQNGIMAEEEGHLKDLPTGEGIQAKGFYEYTGDDGSQYRVDYVADDTGFVPQGAHIHPTPEHVVKLLKYLETNAKK